MAVLIVDPDQFQSVPFPVKAVGLILDEYTSQLASNAKNAKSAIDPVSRHLFSQDEDSGDEGFVTDEDDECNYFDEDEEDNEDAEILKDPVYLVDLAASIKDWIRGLNESHPATLEQICMRLSPVHRRLVRDI